MIWLTSQLDLPALVSCRVVIGWSSWLVLIRVDVSDGGKKSVLCRREDLVTDKSRSKWQESSEILRLSRQSFTDDFAFNLDRNYTRKNVTTSKERSSIAIEKRGIYFPIFHTYKAGTIRQSCVVIYFIDPSMIRCLSVVRKSPSSYHFTSQPVSND